MVPQPAVTKIPAIHPETQMGGLTLRVADLNRSLQFYEGVLGFHRISKDGTRAVLGAEGTPPLLTLQELPGARPMPLRASGLYHFAILVPSRADLGRSLRRLIDAGIEIGQGDHLVSEALYISDPDGNGIEIYRDRPRSTWKWNGSTVRMATDPVDIQGVLAEGARDTRPWTGLPAGTRIGHMHLQVSDTQKAADFYHGVLGFDITAQMPGAVFLSAGGYHHHLGANSWNSRGAGPAPAGTAGLESFVIEVPDAQEQERLAERLTQAGVPVTRSDGRLLLRDPWNNQVIIAVR